MLEVWKVNTLRFLCMCVDQWRPLFDLAQKLFSVSFMEGKMQRCKEGENEMDFAKCFTCVVFMMTISFPSREHLEVITVTASCCNHRHL